MFGVWELFGILIGAGTAAGGAVKELVVDPIRDASYCAFADDYVAKNTDPNLEAELKAKIEDPAWYNWVWERLERCKAENQEPMYLRHKDYPVWKSVGVTRKPFRSPSGHLYVKRKYDNIMLDDNRNSALFMLMHTYGKMTVHQAKVQASEQVVKMYQKK